MRAGRYAVRVLNTSTPYRVVQWTTGNVGKSSVQALAANPLFELVGCYAWSAEKVGRDVGELCGIEPLGILATNDIDELLELKPDCVVYNPMWIDIGELERILSAGVNVVATAAFITGHNQGGRSRPDRRRMPARGSTMFGTGVSPGFAELSAIVAATICDRVDKITITESADTTFYDSPATEIPVGFGKPIDYPELQSMTAHGTAVSPKPCGWSPTHSGSSWTMFGVRPNMRRRRQISTSGRGPSQREVSLEWRPVGRG